MKLTENIVTNYNLPLIEEVSYLKDYRVRFGIEEISVTSLIEIEDEVKEVTNDSIKYIEIELNHKPTLEEIKSIIIDYYNRKCDDTILSGFKFNDKSVWLSLENQLNFNRYYQLAIDEQIEFPLLVKTTDYDYLTFNDLSEYRIFYLSINKYIDDTLQHYRTIKSSINWDEYTI